MYRGTPNRQSIKNVESIFVSYAGEIEKLLVYQQSTYRLEETHAWLDEALQVLNALN